MPAQKRPFDTLDEDPPFDTFVDLQEESLEEDGNESDRSISSSFEEKDEFITVNLSDIRKEVQCPICLGIIRKTRTVMECLHRFCRGCIDKSMRMGNNECPACRTHCASRRSLRDDPNYDALISVLYPDIDKYEEEELAFHEEEKARNKQIQASIAQTFLRQIEALGRKKSAAKSTATAFMKRSQGSYRRGRGRRNQAIELQMSDDDEEEQENGDNGGKDSSSSADERCTEVKPKRSKRWGDGGGDENDTEVNRGTTGPSIGLVGNSERFSWGKGGIRSHTRYNNTGGGNSKSARSSRLSKLVDCLRNMEEIDDEFDIQIKLVSFDEQRMPNLLQPYLSCSPYLSVKHLCQYAALKTQFISGEVEIVMVKELNSHLNSSISMDASASNSSVMDMCKYVMRTLEGQETLGGLRVICNSSKAPLLLAYRPRASALKLEADATSLP